MLLTIKVEQKHIDAGEKGSEIYCPIALAVKEARDTRMIWVRRDGVWIDGRPIKLPQRAKTFVSAYDNCKPVSPFEFELPI